MSLRRTAALALVASCATAPRGVEPPPGPCPDEVVVQKGDTLHGIARRCGVTVPDLLDANRIDDPSRLQVGQRVIVRVVPPPTPPAEPAEAEVEDALRRMEVAKSATVSPPPLSPSPEAGKRRWIWPADGVVITLFGRRDGVRHDGVDLALPAGSPVWASRAGVVLYAGEQPGHGKIVILRHEDATISVYSHNDENRVKDGERVEQGAVIATVGTSGDQPTPTLHFEIRVANKPENPLPFLEAGP